LEQRHLRIENTLSYNALERAWYVALRKDANKVAVGFDEGVVAIKVFILFKKLFSQINYPNLARQTNQRSAWTHPEN
jgi:hypothetical protein